MGKILLSSDWHFCHNQTFLYGPRHCSSIEEMDEKIVERYNAMVDEDDDVYVLGDCILNDTDKGIEYIKRLKGHIHIIRGNHDSEERIRKYKECENIVEITDAKFLNYKKYHFFLSHYPSLCSNFDDNKRLKERMINVCGHSHSRNKFKDFDKGLIYHVEVDAHNLEPVPIDKIIEDLKEKINEESK